jgi:hypothetical protein
MKTSFARITLLLSFTVLGCGKKDADNATGAPPAATAPAPATPETPPAPAKPAGAAKELTAADVPPECKPFMDALDALSKCEKIPAAQRAQMKDGNQKMLKAMVDLGDKKASIDGCNTGLSGLKQALSAVGC